MGHPDAELIRRWQEGDGVAFEELVRRWQGPIARFLARQVGRTELVADLCQEIFLRVFRAGPRYRAEGAFSTWLYQIALNVARDAGRRRRRQPEPLSDHELAEPGQSEAACEQKELAAAVARALAELSAPQREVLVLRHYEGMQFEEIARVLGTPASTLKSRFAAALDRLRVRLNQLGWSNEEMKR
jgi:RNA polymerase sigma-70 factor (ECF subfamily)